ncbi:cobalamin-binding protein [uncultured Microscilla sp.]|uniref:cobalamin-binding protein n=1 Tax=uncultured Microscilla sp. TaxID=432653 RepID=UPI002624DE38|nr:cobalamin-binding protein [uncultured Microscilla sp.]
MNKIISLLPSATEIVCALGFQDQLVGRSHECDYPAGITDLPVCTEAKFPQGSSAEIDQSVGALVQKGLSVYEVYNEVLEKLAPDFVVTQSQCEVCAVSMKDVEAAVCQLISSNPQIINLEPVGFQDVFNDILAVGKALGVPQKAQQLVTNLLARIDSVEKTTQPIAHKKRVACIEWLSPLMNAANWVPTLVEKAGGVNLFGKEAQHSHYIQWADIEQQNPDVILIMPCGFGIARTLQEINLLIDLPGWKELPAVQNGQVYLTDGNQYFNRPGPRLADSVEIISEILYPETFGRKHPKKDWISLDEALITSQI